jgi:hypothetical protein
MASPTYRIGPSDFFTPGDLKADADTLNGQVDELDAQIEGNDAIDQTLVDQWTAFHQTWKAWYASQFGGFFTNLVTALNDANRDQLIQYEKTFANFAQQLQQQNNLQLAGGVIQPSSGSGDTIGAQVSQQLGGADVSGLATKVIVVAVLLVVALFIWKK